MSLRLHGNELFNIGSEIDQVDVYTSIGGALYNLIEKSTSRLASTIQFENVQYLQFNGGFTKDSGTGTFTLSSSPPSGSQGVAPGLSQLTATVFDQPDVPGVDDPLTDEIDFVIGDGSEIHLFKWEAAPGNWGIKISIVDLITAVGASPEWCQLASGNANGTFTYQATGISIQVPAITAAGTMTSGIGAGSLGIVVDTASQFSIAVGGYVKLAPGTPSEEIRRITAVNTSSGLITLNAPTDFSHTVGQFAFHIGWKLGLKVTVPAGITSNTAVNFYDEGIMVEARGAAR